MAKKLAQHIRLNAPKQSSPKKRSVVNEWVPSAEHMRWYEMYVIQHRSYRSIGREVGHDVRAIFEGVKKVGDWIRIQVFDSILEFRARQTETLEQIVADSLDGWQRSIGAHEVVTKKEGATGEKESGYSEISTRSETLCGNVHFLTEARAAMADIRKIWGVDTAQKIELAGAGKGEGLERVAGMTRADAIARRADVLRERADLLRLSEANPKAV